jgi:anaerobic carbon-monoxide dehydrogenase iron sulfur subunit
MRFAIDFGQCTECRRCMIACSLTKTGGVRMGSSRIDIQSDWPEVPEIRVCRFEDCAGHPCIASCPVSAISESEGSVLIDAETCIGCGSCVAVCPFHAIRIERGIAFKCDFCGGDPECVKECVTGALRNGEVAE